MTLEFSVGHCRIRQRDDLAESLDNGHFDPGYWRDSPGFSATIGGRGGSCLIEMDGRRAVLRRYRRGGAVGGLFGDRYLWTGQARTRPWQEWDILLRARDAGLPVPEPLAACTCRYGPWYRAALITGFLDGTEMMTERLRREPLAREHWQRLGELIRQMHAVGIRHADLTPDNILMDAEARFYLVDFDKARVMSRLDDWQWQPLARFQRAITKRNRQRPLHCDSDDWQAFMDGYQAAS